MLLRTKGIWYLQYFYIDIYLIFAIIPEVGRHIGCALQGVLISILLRFPDGHIMIMSQIRQTVLSGFIFLSKSVFTHLNLRIFSLHSG